MTPQEKAAELELKFYKAIQYDVVKSARNRVAKQCAIIAVKEVIHTLAVLGLGSVYYEAVLTELNQP